MDDYYPFGLTFNSYNRENSTPNQYLYNGKERQDELNLGWDDYGWRMYQSEIGRWNRIDDKADKYYSLSPFNFVANNPIIFVDNKGQDIIVIGSGGYNKSVANAFVEYVKTPEEPCF
ncbi:MAG: hypothetical protein HWD62_03770 [Cyclobacteriaceae bacterium]|nr:MAG: hypothetical protein HWD62_03770 [Cyclobacteriaceae bacterium]